MAKAKHLLADLEWTAGSGHVQPGRGPYISLQLEYQAAVCIPQSRVHI